MGRHINPHLKEAGLVTEERGAYDNREEIQNIYYQAIQDEMCHADNSIAVEEAFELCSSGFPMFMEYIDVPQGYDKGEVFDEIMEQEFFLEDLKSLKSQKEKIDTVVVIFLSIWQDIGWIIERHTPDK